ncbi:methylmalonyl-CoA mutase [Patiriisocius marinistellae]|uniref:Methylmalonyl-CoA mutase n=1 Tax=Patiriisocius marinistellae TaxID=2494560 RepID=A0A5J4FXN8_9FLAO|nr:methylmalonyl-CoA mutase subunit beta [Patiriisocius marinistellae]GEQ86098.1 methylmalonyl-CoA mutase [Patiriisocius marinistellae]
MKSPLFSDFEPVSAKAWKQKIQVDLKGADYNDTLVWQSLEGINVTPTYHKDDAIENISIPGNPSQWNIAQKVFIDDVAISNTLAIDAINRGAEAIIFTSEKRFSIAEIFKNFNFGNVTIYFNFKFLDEAFIIELNEFLSEKKSVFYFNIDPIGKLTEEGNWFQNEKTDMASLNRLVKKLPAQNIISVDMRVFQNAGATMVQQLAYGLCQAHEYLSTINSISEVKSELVFNISVGSNYFFEIAKIRALRHLYATLAAEYEAIQTCHIVAQPSMRNKTIYDYNSNMLRTTTECMSAVLGGANTVCNLPYDALYHKSNEFGERISRNQLLVLKAESYFDTVANPADGAYYIESLTKEISEKALVLFKDIEKNGGLLNQLLAGTIQKKIKDSALKEQQLFDQGKIVLLGTNKHPNLNDSMKDNLELYPFTKIKPRKTLISPITPKRLAEVNEKNRLENETI